uniref:Uncharacterized protein n=1 Tax=Anguilla anguilla TaxID=7936 RepID=A0A0E9VNT2_ANGAN
MFAGVSSILSLNEDSTEVLGISSREGEEVFYKTPVSITEHPKINEWLTPCGEGDEGHPGQAAG